MINLTGFLSDEYFSRERNEMEIKTIQIKLQDRSWEQISLVNDNGMVVTFMEFGGIITEIIVPDRDGKKENVVLAYKDPEQYLTNPGYLGALIGRVAGRVQGAAFEIEDKVYHLDANEGDNNLHGGETGFHHVLWNIDTFVRDSELGAKLTYRSKAGEEGFPGNLDVEVTYTVNNNNQFVIDYRYVSDQKTPVTLTNHTYFNLSGAAKHTIHNQELKIDSNCFLELDNQLIPTGRLIEVEDTSFDFRKLSRLDRGFHYDYFQNKVANGGYDHYFLFNDEKHGSAVMRDESSGRILIVETNQPGVVMYTSNNLPEGLELTEGKTDKYFGVCLETQGSPASLHHANLPSILCEAGEKMHKQTTFTFEIEKH